MGDKKKKCTVLEKLLADGFFKDAKEAETWIMMKNVLINNQPVWSLHEKIPDDAEVCIKGYYKRQYVNKGGFKLEAALEAFHIDCREKVVLDCGASTGGFTDCWVQRGAKLVYAVDVGYGQLAGKLINDTHVVNMERTNLSDKSLTVLDPKPEMISLDLSYLSLKKALPICREILKEKGLMICLIKPLFEVESSEIRRSGNINQKELLQEILQDICLFYLENDVDIIGLTHSPVTGNSGTLEYLIGVCWNCTDYETINSCYEEEINHAIEASFQLHKFKK